MTENLALVRLSAINPFLFELRQRGIDPVPILRKAGFPDSVPASSELFVSSLAVYEFVERSAEAAGDEFLGFRIGSQLELHSWEPIAKSVDEAATVGELLDRFVWQAPEHSSATRFYLHNEGEYALFGFRRVAVPVITPAQNDAFYCGFITQMFRRAVREDWHASAMLFTVSDPGAVPTTGGGARIAAGDNKGIRVQFPTQWLFAPFSRRFIRASSPQRRSFRRPHSSRPSRWPLFRICTIRS
jgi:hypothetical protein